MEQSPESTEQPAPPSDPPSAAAPQLVRRRPRRPLIWPSLVVVPLTIVGILMGQMVLGICFAILYRIEGDDGTMPMVERLLSDVRFLTISLMTNFTIIALVAIVGGWFSSERITKRLALSAPGGPIWLLPLVMIGSCFPWALVTWMLPMLFKESSEHLERVQQMLFSLAQSNPLLLITLIAILPPIVEELLVRGYVQTRLVRKLGPLVGITLAGIAFAILHIDPQHAIGVLPLGIWFGFVAWRTGSVFPAMLCHAANNGCAVALLLFSADRIAQLQEFAGADMPQVDVWDLMPVSMPFFMLVSGIAFAASVLALVFLTRPASEASSHITPA